jgi:hypothetical protein
MCLLWGTNWVFIFQKTGFFIVTAVKTSNLTGKICLRTEIWIRDCLNARQKCYPTDRDVRLYCAEATDGKKVRRTVKRYNLRGVWMPVHVRLDTLLNDFWIMPSSGMSRRVDLVRTDVSAKLSASIIRVKRICEQGTTLAATNNRRSVGSYKSHTA